MADPPRHAAGLLRSRVPADRPSPEPDGVFAAGVVRRLPVIPERYRVREKDGVRFVECDEAPRIRAVIDPETTVSKSEAAGLGERVVLLDGAGSFGPLLDNDRKLYNLDHHSGCERLFTLATCEQALLLVHSGLELSEGDWALYANEPDLDTVLALWCLLNHRRVRELRPEARDVLLPLIRLEGAIDANGTELARLCGLPSQVLEQAEEHIEQLLARERGLKQAGEWGGAGMVDYVAETLRAVDTLVYAPDEFGDYTSIEEIYGHVEIGQRRVAVVCRDRGGIYTVEQHMKSRWGDQLGIIALENRPGHYTLRRPNSLAGPDLAPAYELLNRVDPAVDGRPPGKSWGGSDDIGGSPRPRGTFLAAVEILEVLGRAYRQSSRRERLARTLAAFSVGAAVLLLGPIAEALIARAPTPSLSDALSGAWQLATFGVLVLLVGTVATRAASRRRPWIFGWRAPAHGSWWWLAPLVLLCSLPLAAGVPAAAAGFTAGELLAGVGAAAVAAAACEVWFRGLAHGVLVMDFPIQYPDGRWFVSRAALVSALAYAIAVVALAGIEISDAGRLTSLGLSPVEALGLVAGAAFLGGLTLGVMRERAISLWPGIGLQLAGYVLAAAGWLLLG